MLARVAPVLVEAVQELNAKTDSVTTNTVLTKTVAAQQARLDQQAQQLTDQARQITDLRSMLEDLCSNGCAGFRQGGTQPATGAVLYQSIPNPGSGTVSIGYTISMPYTTASLTIITMDGKLIRSTDITGQGAGAISFDGSTVAASTYKYYLMIDGKIMDTKSMAISSK